MRSEQPRRINGVGKGDDKEKNTHDKRCFNCGAREHLSANCPVKELGVKCFECGRHGHIASKCPKKKYRVEGSRGYIHFACVK